MKITVVGQGYVGLPLALAAAEAGFVVFGLDSDKEKIEKLLEGKSVIEDINDENITQYLKMNRYNPTTDPKSINNSDVVLICVPTPLDSSHKPDLTALIAADW